MKGKAIAPITTIVSIILSVITVCIGALIFIFCLPGANADKADMNLFHSLFWGNLLLLQIIRVFNAKRFNRKIRFFSILCIVVPALALAYFMFRM